VVSCDGIAYTDKGLTLAATPRRAAFLGVAWFVTYKHSVLQAAAVASLLASATMWLVSPLGSIGVPDEDLGSCPATVPSSEEGSARVIEP
jgi:hypothetical protein